MKHKEFFVNYIKNQKRFSTHTIRSYSDDLKQFYNFCGITDNDSAILTVDHKIVRGWIVQLMRDNLSPRSVNRKISTLKSFFKYLKREGKIKINPTSRINSPKSEKKLPVFVSIEHMNNLLDNVEFGEDFVGLRNRLIIDILYQTGMRLSELVNLKIVNVNMNGSNFKVLGKRNKERIIPVTDLLNNEVINYISERSKILITDQDYLFVTEKGKKIYRKLVYRVVKNYLTLVTTIEKRSPHILRHTFATHMLNEGADLNTIKEILGHSNLSATQVYTHNTFEKLKTIYKQAHPRA